MAKFCTACGTRNGDSAAFCEECGKPLRTTAAAAFVPGVVPPAIEQQPARSAASSLPSGGWLKTIFLGGALLVVAIGGLAWWLSSPAASADAFVAALQTRSGTDATPSADLLCISNLPYDRSQINVSPFDTNTRRWMDALASAGLYTVGQPVSGGFFQQVIHYTPTPELANWLHGAQLCAAKSWTVSEVRGGPFTPEQHGQHSLYRAAVVWKAEGAAPWLARLSTDQWLPDVKLVAGSLTTESNQVFEIRDRRWVALSDAELREIQRDVRREGQTATNRALSGAEGGGLLGSLKNLFSGFGAAHPLVGEWAIDSNAVGGFLGVALPVGAGNLTFGNDYMESSGQRTKARFEVNGDVVTVRADGTPMPLQFTVKDRNTIAMDLGLMEIPLNRVR